MVVGLRHSSITQYHGWLFRDHSLWLVMEYCDSGSLADILKLTHLSELQIAAVSRSVLSSLSYVHSLHRIHRDIKAANLLVTSNGEVKVCDFGIAVQLETDSSQRQSRIGTPYWMAPEVIAAVGHNTKADIWSFGITAVELFCGAPPHYDLGVAAAMAAIAQGPSPSPPDGASEQFAAFLRTALMKDVAMRPTADDLLSHPFVRASGHRSDAEIIAELVRQYKRMKDASSCLIALTPPSSIGVDEVVDQFTAEESATILYGSGTDETEDPLEKWTMAFLEQPEERKVQKRNFANFPENDLRFLLDAMKGLAIAEIAEGKRREVVIAHYNDVRMAIVEELRRKDPQVPVDFEKIE
jgi:serine/threonine protein kinase